MRLLAGLALWLWLVASAGVAQQPAPLRRFALTVAANDGGPDRERLRYAERDRMAFSGVLEQLGGVDANDAIALVQPSPRAVVEAFDRLRARIAEARASRVRTELVFYYSGHSDDRALLLGHDRLAYAELRRKLDELPVDVRIAILDSCASGAFTRLKGGTRRAPFLVDDSTQLRGHAFLTSSSATEAAQESDNIGGSFFTHYLVSGLRGAADSSGDRKITLTEAYRFAFEETLARTAQTQFGSQHPAYEIRLAGTGDLVMTDLRSTAAEIVLESDVEGRVFTWDKSRALVLEVFKTPGKPLLLALPPGNYTLELAHEQELSRASVAAIASVPTTVPRSAFAAVKREQTLSRGMLADFDRRAFGAGVIPPISTNYHRRVKPVLNHLSVSLLYDDPDALEGLQVGLIGVGARRFATGVQYANLFTIAGALRGFQLSGLANATRTFAYGLQFGFVGNYARELWGGQIAGLNLAIDEAHGFQLGTVNFARALQGAQLGFVNLARSVRGTQWGMLNIATDRVRGMQVGLVNYAAEADVSIALLGITKKGGAHVEVAFSELYAPMLSLRLEANYNYSFVTFGVMPYRGREHRAYSIGGGVGAKIPLFLPLCWLDVDLASHLVQPMLEWHTGAPNMLFQLRVMPRVRIFDHLSVFAGLTVNALLELNSDVRIDAGALRRHRVFDDGELRVRMWPGFVFGLRL